MRETPRPALTTLPWTRRDLLATGLAGAGWATLGGMAAGALEDTGELAGKTLNLVLRYRTDAERIARMLPPGLEPDEVAEVTIDWWLHYPERDGENLFFPGPYTESGIHVTARWQGHRGMFQVGMPLDQDWGRVAGRETVGLVKKDGLPRLWRNGRRVVADLTRRGRLLYRVETEVLDQPAHPLLWHRETGYGAFLYRYRLDPDWRRGPLGPDPVELWLRVLGGKRGVYPEAMVEGAPRRCDPERTTFELVEPSPLDPFAELPLRSIVGVSYRETGLYPDADRRHREARTQSRIERLQEIDRERFAPWALSTYDRPITAGRVWVPAGWPATRTALALEQDELARYRRREALELELEELVDLELHAAAELHARVLPPPLEPGPQPRFRLLALRIERSDLSTLPSCELWLLARCLRDGAPGWYALSHLVGAGGDVVFGRETFGWPSRMATVEWVRRGDDFAIDVERLGRWVVRLAADGAGSPREGAAEVSTTSFEVNGLRLLPPCRIMTEHGFVEPGPRAELVAQPWTLALERRASIDPATLALALPPEAGPGRIGATDPWYELATARVVAASIGRGRLRLLPAAAAATIESWQSFYAERFDGALTSAEATSGAVAHTFQGDGPIASVTGSDR